MNKQHFVWPGVKDLDQLLHSTYLSFETYGTFEETVPSLSFTNTHLNLIIKRYK